MQYRYRKPAGWRDSAGAYATANQGTADKATSTPSTANEHAHATSTTAASGHKLSRQ
jgi:hypothetical protein